MTLAVNGNLNNSAKLNKAIAPVNVTLSPKVRRISARRSRRIAAVFNIVEFGAVGDGLSDSTTAIQSAINACALTGGGTVLVPAGEFKTGALWLKSHITLELHAGSRLCGTDDIRAFPPRPSAWEGPGVVPMHTGIINGEGLENVAIQGRGTIDGNGQTWWDLFNSAQLEYERPRLIRLVNCRDVLIDGVTLTNSPMWTLCPVACDNVIITRVTIRNPQLSPNTDGINPDSCSNVQISNCHIDVGDDCIAIKAGTENDGRVQRKACENIVVSNCTMLHGHGGVVIGSEITGGVRNVTIGNCIFRGTDRGIRIKARRGRGSVVEHICVNNIVMDGVLCPIVINQFYECGVEDQTLVTDPFPRPVNADTPSFRCLRFSNLSARRVKYAAIFVLGLPEMFVEDVVFDNISIVLDPQNILAGKPAMSPIADKLCRAGVRMRNARGIRMRGFDIQEQIGPAFTFDNVTDLIVRDVSGSSDQLPAKMLVQNTKSVFTDDTVRLIDGDALPQEQPSA